MGVGVARASNRKFKARDTFIGCTEIVRYFYAVVSKRLPTVPQTLIQNALSGA